MLKDYVDFSIKYDIVITKGMYYEKELK